MVHAVRVVHESKESTLALDNEMTADELQSLLQAVFGLDGCAVVGFLAGVSIWATTRWMMAFSDARCSLPAYYELFFLQLILTWHFALYSFPSLSFLYADFFDASSYSIQQNGLVVPLSLAIKNPEVVPKTMLTLLVNKEDNSLPPPPHYTSLPPRPPSAGQQQGSYDDDDDDDEEEEDEDEEEEEEVEYNHVDNDTETSTSRSMHEILRFISSLRARNNLSQEQATLLEELLFEDSRLLFAAYSVAVLENNAEYFAQICKGIAGSLQSEDGRDTCVAQDEVLQCCDKLYLAHKITENQLLYLRNLVLIRSESIWGIHDAYSETEDFQAMAVSLYQLANPNSAQSLPQPQQEYHEDEDKESESEDEDDEDEISGKQTFGPRNGTWTCTGRGYIVCLGLWLFLCSVVVIFHIEWCTRKSCWSSCIILYVALALHNTIKHYTNNNPSLKSL